MQTVPQPPPVADYAEGLRRVADGLTGPRAPQLNRIVNIDGPDAVSGAILRGEGGHAIAAVVTIRDGAELVSDSPLALRALAAHASEVADRLEARHAPTCAAVPS